MRLNPADLISHQFAVRVLMSYASTSGPDVDGLDAILAALKKSMESFSDNLWIQHVGCTVLYVIARQNM